MQDIQFRIRTTEGKCVMWQKDESNGSDFKVAAIHSHKQFQ